jgi:hypothetical protein
MLPLAVLIEIGAALGLYFARPRTFGSYAASRGTEDYWGELIKDVPQGKLYH